MSQKFCVICLLHGGLQCLFSSDNGPVFASKAIKRWLGRLWSPLTIRHGMNHSIENCFYTLLKYGMLWIVGE